MKKTALSLLSLPFLFAEISQAVSAIDCTQDIPVKGKKYHLSHLDQVHTLHSFDDSDKPTVTNTTWKVNICRPLKYDKSKDKQQCPHGSNICGDQLSYNLDKDPTQSDPDEIFFPIAGSFTHETGKSPEPKWTNLDEDGTDDVLQLELKGGKYQKIDTKAIIKFQCDSKASRMREAKLKLRDRDDDDDDNDHDNDDDDDNDDKSDKSGSGSGRLTFVSFKPEEDSKSTLWTLRLNWKTKYVCADYDGDDSSKGKWGFFTWFILLLFLGVAAYLIFGSWLNYNRYGARGWDLLPHGDTIRDIPYLVKDWGRKVVDTVTGPGSRGGYAAV